MSNKLCYTKEQIENKLSLIAENKNLLPYPYDYIKASLPNSIEDVGDGSFLILKKTDSDTEILLNTPLLAKDKKYIVSLNVTDIFENITTASGCELKITLGDGNALILDPITSFPYELGPLTSETPTSITLKIPTNSEKGLLIKPQIEEYREDAEMGVWVPNMDKIGSYVDRRFNGTNAKFRQMAELIKLMDCIEIIED